MSDRKKKILKGIILVIPFFIGTIGLLSAGQRVMDAMFDSFIMYFANYGESAPNALTEVARWTAPIVLIGEVLTALRNAWNELRSKKKLGKGNALALYCREEDSEKYLSLIENSVYAGNKIRNDAKYHAVMLGSDHENIEFASRIGNGEVYIELRETDSFLMRASEKHYFNVNEIIARNFWKDNDLTEENVDAFSVAIVGYGSLGKKILKYALMYNVYSLEQHIEYHVYGGRDSSGIYERLEGNDRVIFHEKKDDSVFNCDRVVFTEKTDVELLEELLYHAGERKIFYYAEKPYLEDIYDSGNIICFGGDAISRENIMTSRLYYNAMRLNYSYACRYEGCDEDAPEEVMEKKYNELSGFLKGSNIAACDYHEIRMKILKRDGNPQIVQDDKYVQMEHIRWCRYYFVNNWRYGTPKDKKERDALRIHSCLVPYEKLSREDRDKDLETIQVVMESMSK